jgi:hypothetical protein
MCKQSKQDADDAGRGPDDGKQISSGFGQRHGG